ncbi:MAG: peptidoglycan-binding protein, partial [Clostridia bacterium]|nr:peptidoglycan-binding protein [Clostridia bacterium]
QDHYFDGTCCDCGYTKPEEECEHNDYRDDYSGRSEYTGSYNEEQHEVRHYYNRICNRCEEFLGEITGDEWQDHYFDGTCCDCGYTKPEEECEHNDYRDDYSGRSEYTGSYDEMQHEVRHYYNRVCVNCGEILKEVTESEWQYHDFIGKQCGCGYEKSEERYEHERYRDDYNLTYYTGRYNETYHEVEHHYNRICKDCGEFLEEVTVNEWCDHYFEGTRCGCGYVMEVITECSHHNAQYLYANHSEYSGIFDVDGHNIADYYNLYCYDCSTVIEENIPSYRWEEHNMSGSSCACGYTAEIPQDDVHECHYVREYFETRYIPNDEATHKVIVNYMDTCSCGNFSGSKTEISIEQHNFTGELCGVCNYKKLSYLSHISEGVVLKVGDIAFYVDGIPSYLPTAPKIVQNKLMVPLQSVVEAVGGFVGWSGENAYVWLNKQEQAGFCCDDFKVRNTDVVQEVAPYVENGVMFVELTAIAKIAGLYANYYDGYGFLSSNWYEADEMKNFAKTYYNATFERFEKEPEIGVANSNSWISIRINELRSYQSAAKDVMDSGIISLEWFSEIYSELDDLIKEYQEIENGIRTIEEVSEQKFSYVAKNGTTSATVKEIQEKLVDLGYSSQLVTGYYGAITANNIAYYQLINGLYVNGWVDEETYYLLCFDSDAEVEYEKPFTEAPWGKILNFPWDKHYTVREEVTLQTDFDSNAKAVYVQFLNPTANDLLEKPVPFQWEVNLTTKEAKGVIERCGYYDCYIYVVNEDGRILKQYVETINVDRSKRSLFIMQLSLDYWKGFIEALKDNLMGLGYIIELGVDMGVTGFSNLGNLITGNSDKLKKPEATKIAEFYGKAVFFAKSEERRIMQEVFQETVAEIGDKIVHAKQADAEWALGYVTGDIIFAIALSKGVNKIVDSISDTGKTAGKVLENADDLSKASLQRASQSVKAGIGNAEDVGKVARYGEEFGKMGVYVENPNIKVNWSEISIHGMLRMEQRGINKELIDQIVNSGKVLSQNGGSKYAYITREGVAIVSKEGKLITAWSSTEFDSNMINVIRRLFGE